MTGDKDIAYTCAICEETSARRPTGGLTCLGHWSCRSPSVRHVVPSIGNSCRCAEKRRSEIC